MRQLRFALESFGPLTTNPAHGFAAKHAMSFYEAEAIYSFIPKNGCSNLRYAIAKANGVISDPAEFEWIQENNYTFQASLRELVTARYTFVVLRCPYRRLVSAFVDKLWREPWRVWRLRKAQPQRNAADVLHMRLKRLAPGIAARMQPMDLNAFTFRQFVALLSTEQAQMSDHHWAPQHRFLVYKAYDDIFGLEDFGRCEARLRERLGIELEDTRKFSGHTTHSMTRVSDRFCADTPVAEILAMKSKGVMPDFDCFYDDELRATVGRLYANDLALYTAHLGDDGLLFKA